MHLMLALAAWSAPPTALGQAAVPASATADGAASAEPVSAITVVGRRQSGQYLDGRSTGATRSDTADLEVPQAVRVVPRQLLDDLGALRVDDALDFVAGASRQNNFGGVWDNVAMRGFAGHNDTGMPVLRNGFSSQRGINPPRDTANLERMEFLKGTMGALYGNSEPGGTLNLVTKAPRFNAGHSVEAYLGSFDSRRLALDSTGPIGGDADEPARLAYRLNLSLEDKGSFREQVHTRRELVAPALTWHLSPQTTLRYDGEWQRQRAPMDRGVVAPGFQLGVVPIERNHAEPADGDITVASQVHQFFADHELNEHWSVHAGLQLRHGTLNGLSTEIVPNSCTASGDDWLCRRRLRERDFDSQDQTLQLSLNGRLETGAVSHQLLAGVETVRFGARREIYSGNYSALISVLNPALGQAAPTLSTTIWDQTLSDRNHALYLQDQIELGPQWRVLAGLRHDRYEGRHDNRALGYVAGNRLVTEQSVSATTPRLGLTWLATPEWSAYASVGRSFRPQILTSASGQTFEPEQGTAQELGLKWLRRDGRLGATLAVFDVSKRHVVTYDANGYPNAELAGKVRNQGVEVEFTGWINADWRVAMAYTYLDTDPRITQFARDSGSVFAVREVRLADGGLVGLGGGLTHVGRRTVDLGTVMLPAYTTAKLTAYWAVNRALRLSLDVDNVADATYYTSGYNNAWITPGAPRSLTAGVQYKF